MKDACFFLTKLARLGRHSFEKGPNQSEILFCVLQTSIVGKIDILCLNIDMTCKIETVFIDSFVFIANISWHKNSKDIVFQIKRHVWADIVLKSGCDHTETLLSETGNGFYWLICFNFWKIRKSCFWSKIILLSRYSFKNWARSVLKFAYFNIHA